MSEGTRGSRIGELTRRLMEEIATPELSWPDLDPYPGTVDEVADEIARFVLELEAAGVARDLARKVRDRIEDPLAYGISREPGSGIPVVGRPPEIGTVADLFRGGQE